MDRITETLRFAVGTFLMAIFYRGDPEPELGPGSDEDVLGPLLSAQPTRQVLIQIPATGLDRRCLVAPGQTALCGPWPENPRANPPVKFSAQLRITSRSRGARVALRAEDGWTVVRAVYGERVRTSCQSPSGYPIDVLVER
jgi:hypothetical protein